MKKLTTSVLVVVLSSSFAVAQAQKRDTVKVDEIVFTQPMGMKAKVKDQVTTAQQIITSEQLTQASNPNALNALAGKASGVKISQYNSSVNSSNSIQIRTPRTITGSNEALVVIDNVISSATVLAQLPPDVIESTNIIKGAAGAALYGPQGVNGVVIVTTKKGTKNGKLKVTLNSAVDVESIAYLPTRQREYGQGWYGYKISVENGAWGPAYGSIPDVLYPYGPSYVDVNGDGIIQMNDGDDIPTVDDPGAVQSYFRPYGKDNVKDFFQNGTTYQNTLSLQTGTRDGYFMMTLGSLEREFVVMDDKLSRQSILMKGGATVGNWELEGQVNYIRQKTSTANSTIYHDLLQSAADIPITKFANMPDRAYAWNRYYTNPYWLIKHDRDDALRNYFNIIASAKYKFNDHISLKYTGNLNLTSVESSSFNDGWNDERYMPVDPLSDPINPITSSYYEMMSNSNNYYGDLLLNVNYDLMTDLNMDLLVGYNYQDWRGRTNHAGGTGLITPGMHTIWNVANPAQPYNLSNTRSHYNNHAFFANLDLSYKNYLFFNAVYRYEISSRLRNDVTNNKTGFSYPAFSASFVPTKAWDFGGDILNYMKITAAWQKTGITSSIPVYGTNPTVTLGSGFPFSGNGGGNVSFVENTRPTSSTIRPEFTTKQEVGLSLGFLKDRITFDGSLYKETTKDLITNKMSSATPGLSYVSSNTGNLEGKGKEFNLNVVPVKGKDVRWDISVNYSDGQAIVKELAEGLPETNLINYSYVGLYAVKGESFAVIKGTTYMRDDQGRIIVDATTGLPSINSQQEILGRTTPKYILGLNTSLKVKGFKLSATMDYRTGHQFYSGTMQSISFSGQLESSAGFDRTQPYIIPNSVYMSGGAYVANTSVPIYATTYNNPVHSAYNPVDGLSRYYGGSLYNQVGENFVLDATAFKIREVALSYTFGKNLLSGTGINELTIGVHGRNIFSKFAKENKNYDDPETSYGVGYAGFIANDANQYPNLKTFGGSVTVTF